LESVNSGQLALNIPIAFMTEKKSSSLILKFISHPLVCVVSGVILTLLGTSLYNSWQLKTQTLLSVKGSYYPFEAPSTLFTAYKNYSDSVNPSALEKIAPEIDKLSNGNNSTSFALYNYLNHLQINNVISDLKYINGFWTFSIENKGTMQVENLALLFHLMVITS
jgi:hypothetical protein